MDTVTYPSQDVAKYLSDHFVCFKPQIDVETDLARRYGVKWTPGLLWLDEQGNAAHENVGYFDPPELLAECTFGRGRVAVAKGDWETARERFEEVLSRWPDSFASPAALYWSGVSAKMSGGDVEDLLERWHHLIDRHPTSSWAMKVSFIRDEKD